MEIKDQIKEAFFARKSAYAPYSGFFVGAAILTRDGRVFRGCNVENASYGATMCAERTAVYAAVVAGFRDFERIVIVGGPEEGDEALSTYAYPCGMCRQVLSEFCGPDFSVVVARSTSDYKEFTLEELLPAGFTLEN